MLYKSRISGKEKLVVERIIWKRYASISKKPVVDALKNFAAVIFWLALAFLAVNLIQNISEYRGIAACLAIVAATLIICTYIARWQQKTLTESFLDSDEIDYEFGETGITTKSRGGTTCHLDYKNINKVELISSMLVFWYSEKRALILPTTVFSSEQDKSNLISFVRSRQG